MSSAAAQKRRPPPQPQQIPQRPNPVQKPPQTQDSDSDSSDDSEGPLTSDDDEPTRLHKRAQRAKIDPNARDDVVDDGDVNRVFKICYMPYAQPKDIDDIVETKRVDEVNEKRYQNNVKQMPEMAVLLLRMNDPWKLPRPPNFYNRAYGLYKERINRPEYKQLKAIEFLAARRRYPVKDYPFETAVDQAEETVIREFVEEQNRRQGRRIDLHDLPGVPQDHHLRCDCNYVWDGKSRFCMASAQVPEANRLKITWRTTKDHHFMTPSFEAFVVA